MVWGVRIYDLRTTTGRSSLIGMTTITRDDNTSPATRQCACGNSLAKTQRHQRMCWSCWNARKAVKQKAASDPTPMSIRLLFNCKNEKKACWPRSVSEAQSATLGTLMRQAGFRMQPLCCAQAANRLIQKLEDLQGQR